MTVKPIMLALMFGLAAGPALATPFCTDDRGGVSVTFGIHIGKPYTEAEQNDLDLMELRRSGVDATRVEKWNGCLRAYVRQPGGGETMEYYDPNTLRQVY